MFRLEKRYKSSISSAISGGNGAGLEIWIIGILENVWPNLCGFICLQIGLKWKIDLRRGRLDVRILCTNEYSDVGRNGSS